LFRIEPEAEELFLRQLSILSVFFALIALVVGLSKAELTALPWYSQTLLAIAVLWLVLFGILGSLLTYKIAWGLPIAGIIEIRFTLPQWKRFLRLWSSPQVGRIKAEVRYKYGDMNGWTFPITGDWEEENELWIFLSSPMKKRLEVWVSDPQGNYFTAGINRTVLPERFDVNIRLIAESGKVLTQHTIEYHRTN